MQATAFVKRCIEQAKAVPTKRERKTIARVHDFLVESFAEDVSLEMLTRIAGMSRFHLLRCFAAEVGMPPHAFQIAVRVERARHGLKRGISIGEVASETGFADQPHFTRHFPQGGGRGAYRRPTCSAVGRETREAAERER